jgi:uncharacterized membrane protein YeaQ/YmgE (transglycosylase-associated protein family)
MKMAETELEKAVKVINEKIEAINQDAKTLELLREKLDSLDNKSKNKGSEEREAVKESYQLFMAVILGVIGAELLHPVFEPFFITHFPWVVVAYVVIIVVLLLIYSFIGGFLPRWLADRKKIS